MLLSGWTRWRWRSWRSCLVLASLLCSSRYSHARALQYHEYVLYPYPPLFSCPSTPQVADERDCSVFYECNRDMFGGAKLVRKSCGIGLMFNNVVGVCDWPFRVRNIRPECRYSFNGGLWRPEKLKMVAGAGGGRGSLLNRVMAPRKKKKKKKKKDKKSSPGKKRFAVSKVDKTKNSVKIKLISEEISTKTNKGTVSGLVPTVNQSEQESVVFGADKTRPSVIHHANGKFDMRSLKIFTPVNFTTLTEELGGDQKKIKSNISIDIIKNTGAVS